MKKIIDCFTFFNELDLLEIRLKYLYDTVDFFVIVESDTTFNGNSKELNFIKNRHRYSDFLDKIIYIPLKMKVFHNVPKVAWEREKFQRNAIKNGLDKLNLKKKDLILISDIDEIPNRTHLDKLKKDDNTNIDTKKHIVLFFKLLSYFIKSNIYTNLNKKNKYQLRFKFINKIFLKKKEAPITFLMDNNCFYLNYLRKDKKWPGLQLVNFQFLQQFSVDEIRNLKNISINNINSGWHFTYLGGKEMIKHKIRNFSHQEFNIPEILSDENIDYCIKNGFSLIDNYLDPKKVERSYQIKELSYFPVALQKIIENYPNLLIF